MLDDREVTEDLLVRVVPPEALQRFLEKSPKFRALEQRFGRISPRHKLILRSLFVLLEQIRSSGGPRKRSRYYGYLLQIRTVERREASVKRTGQESESMARYLFELDRKRFERSSPLKELVRHLHYRGSLRLWMDRRTKTLAPGVLSANFNDALLNLLLLNLANPASVAICPRCAAQFMRSKSTQIFCSGRCANNDRKARQRLRERDQKGVEDGARKTR